MNVRIVINTFLQGQLFLHISRHTLANCHLHADTKAVISAIQTPQGDTGTILTFMVTNPENTRRNFVRRQIRVRPIDGFLEKLNNFIPYAKMEENQRNTLTLYGYHEGLAFVSTMAHCFSNPIM
ncbi:hypothetical protein H2248_006353 [Termitomyces sp. 'cryptogamus']|nr:hypothetical protein H2248_006353 [Termitomyces sp. 'cryptogamus']